jgi:hypothetical protein
MTIDAKNEALSAEQLEAVWSKRSGQQFQQILTQLTKGG